MSANPKMRALLLCLLLVTLPAVADVYTYIDAQGNRVFTDQPHGKAHRVDIAPSNKMAAPTRKLSPPSTAKPKTMFRYQVLRILVPEPDATVRSMTGELIVSVSNDPVLQEGHTYRLLVDGQPIAQTGRSPVFPLTNLDRGTHQLAVEILDESGRLLEKTPNQPFHMMRISLAQKRLARPCQETDYGIRPECPLSDKPEEENSILPFF